MPSTAATADPHKFTTIAHSTHRYYSPLSPSRVDALIAALAVPATAQVLDVGCGRGGFLLDLLAASGARGLGVDSNATFIAAAQAAARERGLDARATFVAQPLRDAVGADARFDAIVCMGSSQAVGTLAEAMAWGHRALVPGGVALFADGYWKRPPDPAYLAHLGATADELATHAGNAEVARAAGFRVLSTATANDDEWDEYEGRYCAAMERWLDAHPDDPDAAAMGARIRGWHDGYLRWGRATLGFGFYVLLKPSRASR
jgi:cyclopropane fatty-acyl-phospholipid synthase-like methyltransferase